MSHEKPSTGAEIGTAPRPRRTRFRARRRAAAAHGGERNGIAAAMRRHGLRRQPCSGGRRCRARASREHGHEAHSAALRQGGRGIADGAPGACCGGCA